MMRRAQAILRLLTISAGTAFLLVTILPVVEWMNRWLSAPWSDGEGETLLLLAGSSVDVEGVPYGITAGPDSYWRAIFAVWVWNHGHFDRMVIAGRNTAEFMKPLMVSCGVPEKSIVIENLSDTTRENALFLKPVLERLPGRIVMVTSDYHSRRAARALARAGIHVITRPAPDLSRLARSPVTRWQGFLLALNESTKLAYYIARGWA